MAVRRVMPDFQAPDPGTSRTFFSEVLGLEVLMDMGWIVTYGVPGDPGTQISLISSDATAPVVPDVSVEVDDVDAAWAAVQRLGCQVVHPLTDEPWGVRRFFVREPSGRVLNVLSHR
jgi:predicted enzyme related to lactoylglutathione lyase